MIGCQSAPEEKNYSVVLDSLMAEVERAEDTLDLIFSFKITEMMDTIDYDLDYLEITYTDTMDKETALLVGTYFDQVKSLNKLMKAYMDQRKELDKSTEQLESLESDFDNKLIPAELLQDYFESETKAVGRLNETSTNVLGWYRQSITKFEYLKPQIDEVKKSAGSKS